MIAHPPSTDTGILLSSTDTALVATADGLELYVPKRGDEELMTDLELYLSACLVLFHSLPDLRDELMTEVFGDDFEWSELR